jgi:signal transduction histidine kinase
MRVWRAIRNPTVRLRLAAIYAGIFGVCALILLVGTFVLTANGDILSPGVTILETHGIRAASTQQSQRGADTRSGARPSPEPVGVRPSSDFVQVAVAQNRSQTLTQLIVAETIALVVMLGFASVVSWFAAGRVLKPLRSITATARRLSEQNLQQRIALDGPRDELRDLADTIDSMLDRLAAAFEAQRLFVANASHELRTPLTRERALVDVTLADSKATVRSLRSMGERVRAAVDEQERLIDGLLALARGERGLERRESVDLAALTELALAQVKATPGRGEAISIERDLRSAAVEGDPELLERVVVNLLDNAITHNHDGGQVQVVTQTDGDFAVLHVGNTGSVVPRDSVPVLFQPFRRLGQDRAGRHRGHGLGLSIVASLVAAHGGTVEALPRDEGGMDIYVRLPKNDPGIRPDGSHLA